MADSYELVDGALEGGLESRLRELRESGKSLDAIAAHFTAQGFGISRETVRRWFKRIDAERTEASA